MRLDLVLKQTAIIKRRTVAKELAETGHVSINDKVAKPSSEVKEGDTLTLRLGAREMKVVINFTIKGKKEIPGFTLIQNA